MAKRKSELTALESRFSDAGRKFPDYVPAVRLPMRNGEQVLQGGPRILRYDLRQHGGKWCSVPRDGDGEPIFLDDPDRLEYARQDERAFWRFRTLAAELEPILIDAGVELQDGPGSTPDGRILFWAMGETPAPSRAAVTPNDSAFFVVAMAVQRLLLDAEPAGKGGDSGRGRRRAPNGPNAKQTAAHFIALVSLLSEDDALDATQSWTASKIREVMADTLGLDIPPTARTIQRMLVKEGYRPPKNAKTASGDYDGIHWDD